MKKKKDYLNLSALTDAAECLKCIAHPHRLQIIELLHNGDFTVNEIAEHCKIPQPTTSEHLKIMASKGLLKKERQKKFVYYSVADKYLGGILQCIYKRFGKDI